MVPRSNTKTNGNNNSNTNTKCKSATRYRRWFCIVARVRGDIPLAYLITFRCYGTWLHGDQRGSVDRFNNRYGMPCFPANCAREQHSQRRLQHPPVVLTRRQRELVEQAVRETCGIRKWVLHAVNVRTNHAHTVLSAGSRPESVLNALKANATRQLRQADQWRESRSPWLDGGSRRYVWTQLGLERAIDYVINGQDEPLPSNHLR